MKKLIFVFIAICGLNHAYAQSLTGGSLSSCLIEAEEMTAVLGETIVPTPEKGGYLDAGFIEILLAEAVDAGTDPETPIDPTPGEPEIPTSIDSHKTDPQITSRGGVLFVYTPSLQPVMVIALNGKIVRFQKQVGLQGYEGLPFGTYVIRINEKTFKIQLSK